METEGRHGFFKGPLPVPDLCRNYNRKCGCTRSDCGELHLCYYFMLRNCTNSECSRSHKLDTPRNIMIMEDLGYSGRESIERAFVDMRRRMQGFRISVCQAYNSDLCEAGSTCHRMHVCLAHVLNRCPLQGACDLSHSVTSGEHNVRVLTDCERADKRPDSVLLELAKGLIEKPLMPSICRDFYRNAAGCVRRCTRLHACPEFIKGNCWYGDRCSKRHNLRDPHNQRVLAFYGVTERQTLEYNAARSGNAIPREDGGDMKGSKAPDEQDDRQKLLNYLAAFRRRKSQRQQKLKERQERLQRLMDKQEESQGDGDGLSDNVSAQMSLSGSAGEDEHPDLKAKQLLEENTRISHDLARFRRLVSRQLDALTCPICHGMLKRPVVLSCSHTFCQTCIEDKRRQTNACTLCFQPVFAQTRCSVLDKLLVTMGEMPV